MKALTLFAPVLALLMGHGLSLVADSAPQAKVVGTQETAQFFKVGDAREFYQVDFVQAGNNPADGFFKTNFQCVRAGKLSYIFVEKELIDTQSPFKPADSYLDMVFNHFEKMAPTLHTVYGKPTDMDGNGRFIILVSHIRDWFYHHVETPDMVPVQGYLWPDFVPMNGNDYLTLAHDAPKTDLTGTLVHEFVHNIFDAKNPSVADPRDRGITEALANYAIRINGTLGEDQYFAYQKGVLTQDLQGGKLVNPFDGKVDYLDPLAPDFHQAYAAGYYFMEHIVDECLGGVERRRNAFFQDLIALAPNASSMEKLRCAMIRHCLLPQGAGVEHVERYYREIFAPWLSQKLENNLLTNGGFEKGVRGWKGHLASIGKWEKQPAFEGRQNVWMGGNGKARRESLSQTMSLPMAAEKLTLKFQIHIDTAEKSAVAAHDKFTVSVLGEQGQLLGILDRLSNLDAASGYKEKSYDLSAFKGQKIQIEFKASEDSANQTSFVLDDVCVMGQ